MSSMELPSEYNDPVLYDVENRWSADDDFYLALAKEIGGSVLDVACGTGRLTRAIAEAGIAVVGLDLMRPMLDHARQKLPDPGIEWVHADCRTMQLGRQFDLLLMTSHAFQHLLTDDDITAFLQRAHEHLVVGGTLAFETRVLANRTYVTTSEKTFTHTADLPDGSRLDCWMWSQFDEATEVDTLYFEEIDRQTGQVKRSQTMLRYVSANKLNQLLTANGFVVSAQYGYWDQVPLTADSVEIITICHKGMQEV